MMKVQMINHEVRWITKDIEALTLLSSQIVHAAEKVEQLVSNGDVSQLLIIEQQFEELIEGLKNYTYLLELNE